MPVPTTAVTFSSIQSTFGGSNPVNMSEYYKGGANVPSNQATSGTDGTAISTSGAIRVGMFRGLSKTSSGSVLASGASLYQAYSIGTTGSTASFTFRSDGAVSVVFSDSASYQNWWTAAPVTGIGSSYWIRVTATGSGGSFSGSLGTWISLGTNQTWQLTNATSNSIRTRTLTISIASDSAGSNILATYTNCTLVCDSNFL